MKRYERILVCIDELNRAAPMLAYAQAIVRLAESKKVFMLHPCEAMPEPAGDGGQVPAEITQEALAELGKKYFKDHADDVCEGVILQGEPLLEVIRFAAEKEIDLVIIQRGFGRPVAGEPLQLARRITRKASCSVLVLPEQYTPVVSTIVVPVRDSACSARALDTAIKVAEVTGAKVIPLNVFRVHAGYSRVGATLEEHEQMLKEAAFEECKTLLGRVDTRGVDVTCLCEPDLHDTPVPIILDAIDKQKADLIVIGARGRTGAAGVLLGKVTEELISSSPAPVMAIKKKGECLSIIEALIELASD